MLLQLGIEYDAGVDRKASGVAQSLIDERHVSLT